MRLGQSEASSQQIRKGECELSTVNYSRTLGALLDIHVYCKTSRSSNFLSYCQHMPMIALLDNTSVRLKVWVLDDLVIISILQLISLLVLACQQRALQRELSHTAFRRSVSHSRTIDATSGYFFEACQPIGRACGYSLASCMMRPSKAQD